MSYFRITNTRREPRYRATPRSRESRVLMGSGNDRERTLFREFVNTSCSLDASASMPRRN